MKKITLSKLPEITRGRIERIKVFMDFLELAAIRISNRVDPVHLKSRHERAKTINESYTDAEQAEMYQYFVELMRQIESNGRVGICRDILGQLFHEFGFSRNGQDQSPPDLARLIARLALAENQSINEKGFIDLYECSCGSGSLVLAYAEEMTAQGLSYSEQLVVMATDIDPKCVHMAYIQLSLYGIPAVVIHGETLSVCEYTRWYTPMYILGKWVWRCSLNLTDGKNADDEILKRMTEPLYGAMREAEKLLQLSAGINNPKEESVNE